MHKCVDETVFYHEFFIFSFFFRKTNSELYSYFIFTISAGRGVGPAGVGLVGGSGWQGGRDGCRVSKTRQKASRECILNASSEVQFTVQNCIARTK